MKKMALEDAVSVQIKAVRVNAFRGFSRPRTIQLGRVTLLCGPNGLGKTTVYDAIDWALFGEAWRLRDSQALRNLWKQADPCVELETSHGVLQRSKDRARFADAGFSSADLAVDLALFARPAAAADAVRHVVYLPQDELRDFVTSHEDYGSLVQAMAGVPNAARFFRNVENTVADIQTRERTARAHDIELRTREAEIAEQLADAMAHELDIQQIALEVASFLEVGSSDSLADMEIRLRARLDDMAGSLGRTTERRQLVLRGLATLENARAEFVVAQLAVSDAEEDVGRLQATNTAFETEWEATSAAAIRLDTDEAVLAAREVALAEARERLQQYEVAVARLSELELRATEEDAALVEQEQSHERIETARKTALEAQSELVRARDAAFTAVEERSRLEQELSDELVSLSTKRDEAAALSLRLQDVEELVIAQCTEKDECTAALAAEERRIGEYGESAERLAVLLTEVAAFQQLRPGICPVCSHDHRSAENLARKIAATIQELERQHGAVRTIRELRARLQEVGGRLEEATAASELVRRQLYSLSIQLHMSQKRCDALEEVLLATDSSALQQAFDAASAASEASVEQVNTLTRQLREGELRGGERHARIGDAKAAAAQIAALLVLRDEGGSIRTTSLAEIANEADKVAAKKSEIAAAQRAVRERLARAHRDTTETRALLVKSRVRMEQLRTDRDAWSDATATALEGLRLQDIDVAEGTLDNANTVLEELAIHAAELDKQMTHARELSARLSNAIVGARRPALEEQRAATRGARNAVEQQLEKLKRAKAKLEEIKRRVELAVMQDAETSRSSVQAAMDLVMNILTPHRHLREITLGAKGEVRLADEQLRKPVEPRLYSSTAQMNCVALSAFLGLAMGSRISKLRCILLDEPVQNLDDVNLLSFLDLVRHVARSHQVVLSTASPQIAELFRFKFGLWAQVEGAEVVVHEFRDFDRTSGPEIDSTRAITNGPRPDFVAVQT